MLVILSALFWGCFIFNVNSVSTTEPEILSFIYKECWAPCDEAQNIHLNGQLLKNFLVNKNFSKTLIEFCADYTVARKCAQSCMRSEDYATHMRPFYRRNDVAEFICFKWAYELNEFLPCLKNMTDLKFLIDHCAVFAPETKIEQAQCAKYQCATRIIPKRARNECENDNDPSASQRAFDLVKKLVLLLLREQEVPIARYQKECQKYINV